MSLCSIVPIAPLTNDVFPFNDEHFTKIRQYQQDDLGFLSSQPVRALVGVADVAGSTATGVVGGVTQGVHASAGALFGGIGKLTSGLPGGSLLGAAGQATLGVIDTAGGLAQTLVDPSKVVREHIRYSNDIKDRLPVELDVIDKTIHDFSYDIGHLVQELHENLATKGVQIITGLEARLADVLNALSALYQLLTSNNMEENLKVGQEKYIAIDKVLPLNNHLGELSLELPYILASINAVKAAFVTILSSLKTVKSKINRGVTDPHMIFVERHEDVVLAWQNFEVRRKSMTYLPYKY